MYCYCSAGSEIQEQAQSSVCPWDEPEASNICPWETVDPPPKSQPPLQPQAQLQQQQSFRIESTSGNLKGKPPDRSVSVDVCSIGQNKNIPSASPLPSVKKPSAVHHLTPAASIPKATLNICPWETQELPQKQEKSKSVDVAEASSWDTASNINKKGSNTSIPGIPGSQDIGATNKSPSSSLKSYMDRRPSMHAERKLSTICTWEEESSAGASPAISLQDLHSSAQQQHAYSDGISNTATQRLSTDISQIKISVESDIGKSAHRELSASISVPCTTILGAHAASLDYTVRSGHMSTQFSGQTASQPSTQKSFPHSSSSHSTLSGTTSVAQYSTSISSPEGMDESVITTSVPTSPNTRRVEPPRTVSVSSQTQTDPIVQRKTNQQTQHPARDSVHYSSKHSSRHSKQKSTPQCVGDLQSQSTSSGLMQAKHPSNKSQHMEIQVYQKPMTKQQEQVKYCYDQQYSQQQDPHTTGQAQVLPDQQLVKCSQQQRQHQYLLSRDEHEQQQRVVHEQQQQRKTLQQQQQLAFQYQDQKQLKQIELDRHQELLERQLQQKKRDQHRQVPDEQHHQMIYDQERQFRHHDPPTVRYQTHQQYKEKCSDPKEGINPSGDTSVSVLSSSALYQGISQESSNIQSDPSIEQHKEHQRRSQECSKLYQEPTRTQTQSSPQLHTSSAHHQTQIHTSHQPFQVKSSGLQDLSKPIMSTSIASPAPISSSQEAQFALKHAQQHQKQQPVKQSQHRRHLSGDHVLLSSSHGHSSKTRDIPSLSKSTEEASTSKLSTSPPKTVAARKVWDDPSDICPWEDE